MTDDIVARLRNSYGQGCTCFAHHSFECSCDGAQWVERYVDEAADEIERLRDILDQFARWTDLHITFDYPLLGATSNSNSIFELKRLIGRYKKIRLTNELSEHSFPSDKPDNTVSL